MARLGSRATVGGVGCAWSRRWRWRVVAGIVVLFGLLAVGGWGAANSQAPARFSLRSLAMGDPDGGVSVRRLRVVIDSPRSRSVLTQVGLSGGQSIEVGSGAAMTRFDVAEPAGVIRLLRLTVPHGTRADLAGVIPEVAGIAISTPRSTGPSETCHRRGVLDVCTQAEQACPMPAATWQFQLRKLAGPPGRIRLDFVIGPATMSPSRPRPAAVHPVFIVTQMRVSSGRHRPRAVQRRVVGR